MKRYMLDTNTVSHLIKKHPGASRRLVDVPMASLCVSSITGGELLFGLAKRPDAKRLHAAVKELLLRVDVLPWNRSVLECYGTVRAGMAREGANSAACRATIPPHAGPTFRLMSVHDSG